MKSYLRRLRGDASDDVTPIKTGVMSRSHNNELSAAELVMMATQVCDAVRHLHSLNIIHRDLAARCVCACVLTSAIERENIIL